MTIKHKLTAVLMAASTIAICIMTLLFYNLVDKHFQETYHNNLQALASIVGENCQAALLFDVPEDASTILNALGKRQSILQVALYDQSNTVFASFLQSKTDRLAHETFSAGMTNTKGQVSAAITLQDGSIIGHIYIHDDMREISASKHNLLYILLSVAAFTLILAFFLSSLLQRIISKPIQSLTTAVQDLSDGHFPNQQPECMARKDEMGLLCAAFFEMSTNLKKSHEKLEEYTQTLAHRVEERTAELKNTLNDLANSQSQLVQSEKMAALGLMVAGVAHEVNNNINYLSAAIPSIARRTDELVSLLPKKTDTEIQPAVVPKIANEIQELLDDAQEGVRRTKNIIRDLTTFSQPSYGQYAPTNVNDEIKKCITLLHYESQDKVEFFLELSADLPPLTCIHDQINQVYFNILLNAIQAIEVNGKITVTTFYAEDMVNIIFQDNGPGISNDAVSKIFDPFYTTKEPGKGTGLGLSISYSIVQKHNGDIQIDSKEGVGTSMTVRLPLNPAPSERLASTDRRGDS